MHPRGSLFPDTDAWFGSRGSFFDFFPASGSFECNPPFVDSLMTRNVAHIENVLSASEQPLSFVVFVPPWNTCDSYRASQRSKFLRRFVTLPRRRHKYVGALHAQAGTRFTLGRACGGCRYRDGMQHRVPRDTWDANVDSFVFWLQNDAGHRKWPVTDDMVKEFLAVALCHQRKPGRG